ncbi:RNA polymerase sigma factor [Flavivirga sp. 57AJ16]|uniref:RNA polymerase sigma factor n=1 Tax=Flavivirga sp. 57AJ16 TaxID=3025307 RepID=UPI002365D066|nr:sigma-70 family RNA polymerase sigma factor [Flavivirga sp. 57AJ16]MDD7885075.1 sigma-70 family RNA polymerase sigma factor [Flavivirga sp. 57AJ16]
MEKRNEHNDFDIIRQVVDGKTDLFRILVDKYKDQCLSLVHTILKNEDNAQDVLQEGFIKAYKNLSKFDFKSSFATWLYRIMVNTSYTFFKKSKRVKTVDLKKVSAETSVDTSSFDFLREEERKEFINKVLQKMKPNDVLVLKLFYLGEQSINEITEITGLSNSNIKVLLHRSRKEFHNKLEELLGPEKKHLLWENGT